MRLGTGYIETGTSGSAAREFATALDRAGFDFVTMSGHVLSAAPDRYEGRPNALYVGPFRDPFVLFSHMAAVTERVRFRTSILILPMFPTALVARQAAELSELSGGRLDLGVGISWHEAEYAALGAEVRTRGRRLAEQVALLRRFWTEPFVEFEGRFHQIHGVGLNRLPEHPIPIWIGCGAEERLLRRVARLADGWLPFGPVLESWPTLRGYLEEAGRDVSSFGVGGRVVAGDGGPEAWVAEARRQQELGATDLSIAAPGMGPAEALARLIEAREVLAREL
jgi:probable F420-dependent oxidoreductase